MSNKQASNLQMGETISEKSGIYFFDCGEGKVEELHPFVDRSRLLARGFI